MTDIKELIARLRGATQKLRTTSVPIASIAPMLTQSADALESIAKKLAALEQQEPTYLLTPDGKCYAHGSMPPLSVGYADATLLKLYLAPGANPDAKDAELLDWLGQNFYSRENLDFITGRPSLTHTMWVFFAPLGVQGDIRRVLNAAIEGAKK